MLILNIKKKKTQRCKTRWPKSVYTQIQNVLTLSRVVLQPPSHLPSLCSPSKESPGDMQHSAEAIWGLLQDEEDRVGGGQRDLHVYIGFVLFLILEQTSFLRGVLCLGD